MAAVTDLVEARESLTYWESRLQTLPRRAVRKRREAREMAARWQVRVSEVERIEYGAGLLGALVMVLAERRLPVRAHQTGRQLVRIGLWTAAVVVVLLVALVAAVAAAALAILL